MTTAFKINSYCAYIKDKKILSLSSSGGIFYALASYYLSKLNGVVYGSSFEDGNVIHKRVTSVHELNSLMRSKYSFSLIKNTFKECMCDLNNDKYVFFVGVPCQIAGLHKFLDNNNVDKTKLLTADLFCHGSPKPEFFQLWINELFGKSNVSEINFRYKNPYWDKNRLVLYRGNNLKILHSFFDDPYICAFLKNYTLLESCYSCGYKGENRKSDITLGDFWGVDNYYPELKNNKGTSLVIIRNKIDEIIKILQMSCCLYKVSYSLSLVSNPSYFEASLRPTDYAEITNNIKKNGFNSSIVVNNQSKKKTILASIKSLVKRTIKSIFKKRIFLIRKNDVGIITDHDYSNFGNRLQNYALRMILKRNGYNSVNISSEPSSRYFLYTFYSNLRHGYFSNKNKRYRCIRSASKSSGEKVIPFSYEKIYKSAISKFKNIIFGSDQIWNVNYNLPRLPFHLGLFGCNEGINKISFAASFGLEKLNDVYDKLFAEGLSSFSKIGLREESGVKIIEKLGYQGNLNLDPTLLLDSGEWDKAISKFSKRKTPDCNYVIKYCLKSKETNANLSAYANMRVIDILDSNDDYYVSNHFDFIKCIKNSSLVITDSFHAFIFSIIYRKKIILLHRKNMETRLVSLCKLIGINYSTNIIIDLSTVDISKLKTLKDSSIEFLISGLK